MRGELWRSAWKSLSRQWTRTCLTAGSITVGVVLVTVVSAISRTGTQAVSAELDDLGMSGLSVGVADGEQRVSLTAESLSCIRAVEGVETAVPLTITQASARLCYETQGALTCGVDGGSVQAISIRLRYGRLLTRGDVEGALPVCVVDEDFARKAYSRGNIVGKTLWLTLGGAEHAFEVVGVAEAGSSLLQNLTAYIPSVVLIPYTTMEYLTGTVGFDQIAVRATPSTDMDALGGRIAQALDRLEGVDGGFETENLARQKDRLSGLLDIVALILTLISGISLLVSGLGIMTIMLVSVNERVREIGIKKAIGAPSRRILGEFLAESVVLSLLGGGVGLLLGVGAVVAGTAALSLPLSLPIGELLGVLVFCVAIGAAFGVYPAMKASRLRPVEAFRRE